MTGSYIPFAIFGISLVGVLYSTYLTYLELFVIYAICRWCVSSALIITAIFVVSPNLSEVMREHENVDSRKSFGDTACAAHRGRLHPTSNPLACHRAAGSNIHSNTYSDGNTNSHASTNTDNCRISNPDTYANIHTYQHSNLNPNPHPYLDTHNNSITNAILTSTNAGD